jgi:NADPH:quinone reductase-like Zn-dependent oxidoreductase
LVNGATGSTGVYVVQLARFWKAQVTAVCSARNFELVQSLGAGQVIDYKQEDFTQRNERYDVVFDAVGKLISGLSKSKCQRVLKPGGTYLSVEMGRDDKPEDLTYLAELMVEGGIQAVIDRTYPLEQTAEAHRYVEQLHKTGVVVINIVQKSS